MLEPVVWAAWPELASVSITYYLSKITLPTIYKSEQNGFLFLGIFFCCDVPHWPLLLLLVQHNPYRFLAHQSRHVCYDFPRANPTVTARGRKEYTSDLHTATLNSISNKYASLRAFRTYVHIKKQANKNNLRFFTKQKQMLSFFFYMLKINLDTPTA